MTQDNWSIDPGGSKVTVDLADRTLALTLSGRLDATTTGDVWRRAFAAWDESDALRVEVRAGGVTYLDAAGCGLLIELERRGRALGARLEVIGLAPDKQALLDIFKEAARSTSTDKPQDKRSLAEEVGAAAVDLARDTGNLVAFVGEACQALGRALLAPSSIRWRDAALIAEAVGVNAVLIVALIGFLMGLIMSFQSAIPLRQFGAEIYVANLLGLSMLRELGPLVTAILLAGRSGSSFAAELGTMTVNDEVSALTTMAIDPVRFLVVPRLIAALAMTPLLTVIFELFSLVGGGVVISTLGFPIVTYLKQVSASVSMLDFLGGLLKSCVFSLLVAGIGCMRGLTTGTGSAAVGASTTSAVVSGIILIAIWDGIFAVAYYALGI